MEGTQKEIGTLNQQLLAVEYFLDVPRNIRDQIGKDTLWEHIHHAVLNGLQPTIVDVHFREKVLSMRLAQQRVRASRDRAERGAAMQQCSQIEIEVDLELRRTFGTDRQSRIEYVMHTEGEPQEPQESEVKDG